MGTYAATAMQVVVTGSSGPIGNGLCSHLASSGHHVVRVVRRPVPPGEVAFAWDPETGNIDARGLEGADAVVHLAGAGIGDSRWSEARKRVLVESRTRSTALLASALAGLDHPPRVLVSASAIGFYGDRGDELLTEESPPGDDFLASLCVRWEAEAAPAAEAGVRVVCARTGLVLSKEGGALPKLLPLFKLGLGGRFGSGAQWWSWITLDDEIRAIAWLLENDVRGPVNLTAPIPSPTASSPGSSARCCPDRPGYLCPGSARGCCWGPSSPTPCYLPAPGCSPQSLNRAGSPSPTPTWRWVYVAC